MHNCRNIADRYALGSYRGKIGITPDLLKNEPSKAVSFTYSAPVDHLYEKGPDKDELMPSS